MKKIFISLLFVLTGYLFAGGSLILEAEGIASLGDNKSKKETMQEALENAKRAAAENAQTYIKSESVVKNYQTESDLVESYSRSTVSNVSHLSEGWFTDSLSGLSYKIKIRCEVIPDENYNLAKTAAAINDPLAPLTVTIKTEQTSFQAGQTIKIYLVGNKPFFARVLYLQADGSLLQLLPNPYRSDNYFNGGTQYELPSGNDRYALTVSEPFGTEKIILYASTRQPGSNGLVQADVLYKVSDDLKTTASKTRGIKITEGNKSSTPVEFFETELKIKTQK